MQSRKRQQQPYPYSGLRHAGFRAGDVNHWRHNNQPINSTCHGCNNNFNKLNQSTGEYKLEALIVNSSSGSMVSIAYDGTCNVLTTFSLTGQAMLYAATALAPRKGLSNGGVRSAWHMSLMKTLNAASLRSMLKMQLTANKSWIGVVHIVLLSWLGSLAQPGKCAHPTGVSLLAVCNCRHWHVLPVSTSIKMQQALGATNSNTHF